MITDVISEGTLLFALPLAFAAGLLAFVSPCVLPLAPGYLSYITSLRSVRTLDVSSVL